MKSNRIITISASLLLACSIQTVKADAISFTDPHWQFLSGVGSLSASQDTLVSQGVGFESSGPGWSVYSPTALLPVIGTQWQLDIESQVDLSWCTAGNDYSGPTTPTTSCSAGAQRSEVGIVSGPVTEADRSALGGSLFDYFDFGVDAYYGYADIFAHSGDTTVTGLLNPVAKVVNDNVLSDTVWYRFVRTGDDLAMSLSDDGINYIPELSTTLGDGVGDAVDLAITTETYLTAGSKVTTSNLAVTSAPEPATWWLVGVGAGMIALGKIRRKRSWRVVV
jgi:hypothetical protein